MTVESGLTSTRRRARARDAGSAKWIPHQGIRELRRTGTLGEVIAAALAQPPGRPPAQDPGGHERQRVQPGRPRAVLPRRRQANAREAPISPTDERTIS